MEWVTLHRLNWLAYGASFLHLVNTGLSFLRGSSSDEAAKKAAEQALNAQPEKPSAGMRAGVVAALSTGLLGLSSLVSDAAGTVLGGAKGAVWALAAWGALDVYRRVSQASNPSGSSQVTVNVHINGLEVKGKKPEAAPCASAAG